MHVFIMSLFKKLKTEKVFPFFEQKQGVFVEVGAGDGEDSSPTLFLERWYSWTGMLLEMNPHVSETLMRKNRRSILGRVAVSTNPFPEMVSDFPFSNFKLLQDWAYSHYIFSKFNRRQSPVCSHIPGIEITSHTHLLNMVEMGI